MGLNISLTSQFIINVNVIILEINFRLYEGSDLKTNLLMRCGGLMLWLFVGPTGFT